MDIDMNYIKKIQNAYGTISQKERDLVGIKQIINDDFHCPPNFNVVIINNSLQDLLIINDSQDIYTKKIKSRPDERFNCGDIIAWDSIYWLVTEINADTNLYTQGKMQQCNYIIKFQNKKTGDILSYPVIYKKTSAFINESKDIQLTIKDGKSTILIPFCKDVYNHLNVNDRLIIDNRVDIDTPNVFRIVNVDTTTKIYNGHGLIVLTLEDDEFNKDTDSIINWVADYKPINNSTGNAKIIYSGNAEIKCGGSNKIFKAEFKDADGNILHIEPIWSLSSSNGDLNNFITIIDNDTKSIKIKCKDIPEMIGTVLTLTLSDESEVYFATLDINIVAL